MDTVLSDADAADLLARFTEIVPRKSRVGRYVIMFRNHSGPFFMNECGRLTIDWKNAVLYDTADEAHRFLVRIMASPLPKRVRLSEGYLRLRGNAFDNCFLFSRQTARIYEISRELPERWVTNDHTIKVLQDGTLDLSGFNRKRVRSRSIAVLNANTTSDTYGEWSSRP